MGGRQRRPLGLASQKFFCGCEGLVIVVVVVAVDSPGLLAPSTLPFPFALAPHLPPPLPLLFLPFIGAVDSSFFSLWWPLRQPMTWLVSWWASAYSRCAWWRWWNGCWAF